MSSSSNQTAHPWEHLSTSDLATCTGPTVWPSLHAQEPADRFIYGRPELTYLAARHRQLRIRADRDLPGPRAITVKLSRSIGSHPKFTGHRKWTRLGSFEHTYLSDRTTDVRSFLIELRNFMRRKLPTEPCWGTKISVHFLDRPSGCRQVGSYTQFWH